MFGKEQLIQTENPMASVGVFTCLSYEASAVFRPEV